VFGSSPRDSSKVDDAELPLLRGGVEQRPRVRLLAGVQQSRIVVEHRSQGAGVARARELERSAFDRQRLDVCLERSPAGEAVLFRRARTARQ
jgi:hypothetical protein